MIGRLHSIHFVCFCFQALLAVAIIAIDGSKKAVLLSPPDLQIQLCDTFVELQSVRMLLKGAITRPYPDKSPLLAFQMFLLGPFLSWILDHGMIDKTQTWQCSQSLINIPFDLFYFVSGNYNGCLKCQEFLLRRPQYPYPPFKTVYLWRILLILKIVSTTLCGVIAASQNIMSMEATWLQPFKA